MSLLIRGVIFEHFNEDDLRFNNDQVLEMLVKSNLVDSKTSTENLEEDFEKLCKDEILRNIAQNLTTVWYKTFEALSEYKCTSCNTIVHISKSVDKKCPNPECKSAI